MNEGESAGGGHQGSSPAPPAVPDRRSTTLTSAATGNSSVSNPNHTAPSIITLVTTSGSALCTQSPIVQVVSSTTPRSFQQAFTQQQKQQSFAARFGEATPSNSRPSVYMPQTSSTRLTTSTAAASQAQNSTLTAAVNRHNYPIITPGVGNFLATPTGAEQASKKQKLESTAEIVGRSTTSSIVGSLLPTATSTTDSITTAVSRVDVLGLSKALLEKKKTRLRYLKQRHADNVAEKYFMQSSSNMNEFQTWRKKPPSQTFLAFSDAHRADIFVEKTPLQQQQQTAENIANIIGVVSSGGASVQQKQPEATATTEIKTTTQTQQPPPPAICTAPAVSASHGSPVQSSLNDPCGNVLPQGAEIKIPAVGATPVAVSTKLPAAVVQLTQQGGTPLVPCTPPTALRRNGNGVSPLAATVSTTGSPASSDGGLSFPPPLYTSTRLVASSSSTSANGAAPVGGVGESPSSTSSLAGTVGSANSAQEFSFKAKQEVYVMQRISELQREGLWTEKRLPKLMEPNRPKAHWDYLLEEMVWLAADFAQERKWKKAAAKKCAKMVQKYFQDKANAAQKAEKAHEAHLRRISAFISKEVKMFWSNVEKLVEYKHHTKIEEKRKKALDQHLSFIVDQTEKFSQQLAEGMNKSMLDATASVVPSLDSSRISSPKRATASDDEFRPESGSEDDEETIAKAEEEATDVKEEVAALEKESQMELDDFIKDLPQGYLENRDKILLEEKQIPSMEINDETDDTEFEATEPSDDDENTIMKQEEQEKDVDHKQELNELEADNDLSVEQLMAKYKAGKVDESPARIIHSRREIVSDDSNEIMNSDDTNDVENGDDSSENETLIETSSEADENEPDDGHGLKSLLEDPDKKNDMIEDAAALAESIQPTGNTLSSTNVVTPVPFLLKHTLREYQHIGLDWLVTMNERKLNGILADEMGLGKTIQTIALLAHLACVKGNWGPHLIVVPSSVMLNWEMEFKKWCPAFKILTYYGTQKERKLKRVGWTKPNAFHVCITSYKLVVQDQQSFRRKKWKYLILDEAQNIKNFKSQRWQLLLNFSTDRRLLLTGTPLQNDLMELWSLMHFLMPYVFSSHREFKEWFSNPMASMVEGNIEYNEKLISRLHKVIRPFLLRRLKKEVEKQMPKKYEHVVMCRLSNRQRYLYDDFMSRSKTKETLQTGNLLSVINVLMQLRKVCNHPNMFEVRPTISPFQMESIIFHPPSIVCDISEYDPLRNIDMTTWNFMLIGLECTLTAYVSYKSRLLAPPNKLIEEVDAMPPPPPPVPTGKFKFHIRVREPQVQHNLRTHSMSEVHVGASPAMKTEGNNLVPVRNLDATQSNLNRRIININSRTFVPALVGATLIQSRVQEELTVNSEFVASSKFASVNKIDISNAELVATLAQQVKSTAEVTHKPASSSAVNKDCEEAVPPEFKSNSKINEILQQRKEQRLFRLKTMARINKRRTEAVPIYGSDCRESFEKCMSGNQWLEYSSWHTRGFANCRMAMAQQDLWSLTKLLKSYPSRCEEFSQIFDNFVIYVPSVCAARPRFFVQHLALSRLKRERDIETTVKREISPKLALLHPIISAMTTQFPDPRLIQYDCGKLQTLDRLLRQLKSEQHRVLIFTQMTKMLDVLEAFLNYHGHIYLRLDGSTRVEQRQVLMERFNGDKRIFCFILSTRSGGVGINLTGADTVIFYDSDWNPTMDAQAQDRCHRIGQTRDVHIYRLVSEKTIEVNILKKANQKRMLSDMAIEGGNFTTTYFKSSTIKDLFNMEQQEQDIETTSVAPTTIRPEKPTTSSSATASTAIANELSNELETEKQSLKAFETALAAAEDEQDVLATKIAKAEAAADLAEFDETIPIDEATTEGFAPAAELSRADLEMQNLVNQLSPIERYAMRFVEETGAAWTAQQLLAAEAEIEAQKREWEANRLSALQKEEEMLRQEEAEEMLTYSRKDANNQVNRNRVNANRTKLSVRSRKTKPGQRKRLANLRKGNSRPLAAKSRPVSSVALRRQRQQSPNKKSPIKNRKIVSRRSVRSDLANNISNNSSIVSQQSVAAFVPKGGSDKRSLPAPTLEVPAEDVRMTRRMSLLAANVEDNKKIASSLAIEDKGRAENKGGTGVKNQKLLTMAKRKQLQNAFQSKRRKLNASRTVGKKKSAPSKSRSSSVKASHCDRELRNTSRAKEHRMEEATIITECDHSSDDEDEKDNAENSFKDDSESSGDNSDEQEEKAKNKQETHNKGKLKSQKKLKRRRRDDENDDEADSEIEDEVEDDVDDDGVPHVNADDDDRSSYATARNFNSTANSVDLWNADAQMQDTTTTNSTYYNVSEESDTDDNETTPVPHNSHSLKQKSTPHTLNSRSSRSLTPGSSATHTVRQQAHNRTRNEQRTPRTRSRGSVKIDLWTLDVSPILPAYRTVLAKSSSKERAVLPTARTTRRQSFLMLSDREKDRRPAAAPTAPTAIYVPEEGHENANCNVEINTTTTVPLRLTLKPPPLQQQRKTLKRLSSPNISRTISESESKQNSTLHRWLLKSPRVSLSTSTVSTERDPIAPDTPNGSSYE